MKEVSWENPCSFGEPIHEGHLGGTSTGGDPTTWYPELWTWLIQEFNIHSMLDLGCGLGHAVKFFNDSGIFAVGIDGCKGVQERCVIPNRFVLHDFTKPHRLEGIGARFNLIYSSEFLEHLEERYLPNVFNEIKVFTDYISIICISPAKPNTGGHHHVNMQESKYWINMFEDNGFSYLAEETQHARSLVPPGICGRHDSNKVPCSHFNQNGLLFKTRLHEQQIYYYS